MRVAILALLLGFPCFATPEQDAQREAVQATYDNPDSASAWFALGEAEEKLGNKGKAITAFTKVVELEPSSDLAKQSLAKIRALGSDKKAAATPAPVAAKPAPSPSPATPAPAPAPVTMAATPSASSSGNESKGGVVFGFSPVYKPKVASDLGGTFNKNFEIGVKVSPYMAVSLRVASGTAPSLQLADGTLVLKPSHSLIGIAVHGDIPVTEPGFLLDHIQFIVPVGMMSAMNWISARGTPYTNLVLDLYAGGGARYNITPLLFFDLAAMYHFGIALKSLESDPGSPLKDTSGENISGGTTGFELRLAFTILF